MAGNKVFKLVTETSTPEGEISNVTRYFTHHSNDIGDALDAATDMVELYREDVVSISEVCHLVWQLGDNAK